VSDRDLELIPYSMRRRPLQLNTRLPQDRSADEDLEAVTDEAIRRQLRGNSPNLGFAEWKGRNHG